MTKLKFLIIKLKGYYSSIKCIRLIKKQLMERSESRSRDNHNGTKKKIRAHKQNVPNGSKNDIFSSNSEEAFIPLAVRDSKWVDLAFYNPNFKSQQEEDECDEEELQIIDIDGVLKPPILLLFPGLSQNNSTNLISNLGSTSDVTKMLVGQKADFSRMKSSRKLLPAENKLTSVQEMPQEENESTSPQNEQNPIAHPSTGHSDILEPNEIQDTDEEVTRKTHVKKRKKLSDVATAYDSDASVAVGSALRKRPYTKPRPRGHSTVVHKDGDAKNPSSTGSLGDDEED